MHSSCDSSAGIIFQFKLLTLKMFFHMWKQPINTWGKIWRVGRMCQHLPAPAMHQVLHIMIVMRCCTVLEQSDTTLKEFWLFMVKSWSYFNLQECAVILATDHHTSTGWSSRSPFWLKNTTCMTFRAPGLCRAIIFLGDVWACHSEFWHFS